MSAKNLTTKTTIQNLTAELKATFAKKSHLPTKVSQLTNDSNYQNENQVTNAINAKLGSVYKPGGTVAFANLPALIAANEGFVYNISDAFTTTADFVEGAGKKHKAGADVGIVNTGTAETPVYKYNVFANFVDLSGYMEKVSGGTTDALVKQDANGQVVDTGVDVNDVVTKVDSATNGHLAGLDANGKLTDSGKAPGDFALRDTDAVTNNIAKFDANGDPVDAGIAATDIVTKVDNATNGHLAGLDANGKLTDSGKKAADFVERVYNQDETEDVVLHASDISDYTAEEIAALLADDEAQGGNGEE